MVVRENVVMWTYQHSTGVCCTIFIFLCHRLIPLNYSGETDKIVAILIKLSYISIMAKVGQR